ncbi:hypothetical protein [uncultured Methanobacterium sp.]|uniref:hypothetical protein n=1 Tax=uncultured Methanobacterium sp. TaxID=176306 RepID=UPI002AA8FA12|nr:hypothetical protein [uncultured Methanobacterium sp.]
MDEDVDKKGLEEWKTIRELISDYDTRKHELRKTGFSLITSLIAAQGILYIYWNYKDILNTASTTNSTFAIISSSDIITVVLGVTIALIFAIIFFEKGYRLYQEAAVQRALLLEKKINLQLTETIFYQFKSWQSRVYEYGVYCIFFACALLMAYVTKAYWVPLLVFTIIGVIGMLFLTRDGKENYKPDVDCNCLIEIYKERIRGWVNCEKRIENPYLDWSFYPIVCKRNEKVVITLTNLNGDDSFTEFILDENNSGRLKKQFIECKNPKDNKSTKEIVFTKDDNISSLVSMIRVLICLLVPCRGLYGKKVNNKPNKAKPGNLLFKIVPEDICQNYNCENFNLNYPLCSETNCIQEVIKVDIIDPKKSVFIRTIPKNFKIKAGSSRTWLWDTTGVQKGIYLLYTPFNDPEILSRKIRIV